MSYKKKEIMGKKREKKEREGFGRLDVERAKEEVETIRGNKGRGKEREYGWVMGG